VVKTCCENAGLDHIAPHDLRRTCANLCHDSGGELGQIQLLLGHASVQTTERYLGCKQNLRHPVNDLFDLNRVAQSHRMSVDSAAMKGNKPVETGAGENVWETLVRRSSQ
jgi:Phage integrase family